MYYARVYIIIIEIEYNTDTNKIKYELAVSGTMRLFLVKH